MAWTQDDVAYLRSFRDDICQDNIKLKQQVKRKLLDDKYIIHALNNKELEDNDAEPDDYFGVNILDYYSIIPTQTDVQNFLCFETAQERYSGVMKLQQLIFYILCDDKNIRDKDTSLARHDLLAALVINMFNYDRFLGGRFELIYDVPSVVDNHYIARTLKFQQRTDNNLSKTISGKPKMVNKDYTGATQI